MLPVDLSDYDISFSGLIAGFLFGVIGWWLFRDGKRRAEMRIVIIGLVLMIYPYFTSGPKADWGIGIALCGLAYYLRTRGLG
jgi:hypothetical protein